MNDAEPREEERDQRPGEHGLGDGHRREQSRPGSTVQNHEVAEDRLEVVEADPRSLMLDQLDEAVLLEREREEAVQRIAEHGHDHDERRQHEHVRRGRDVPAFYDDAVEPALATAQRWKDGLGGGDLAHAERQLIEG